MRRAVLTLGLSLSLAGSSFAELPSQLELVRALRSAGLVDLAIMRLEELRTKKGLLSAEEAKLVPLELARIRLEQASLEPDDSRRMNLITLARALFDEFIRANPTHPMAAQANVEIARLFALQAKGLLSQANRIENRDAKAAAFSRARPDFTTAINRYQGAITNLETRIKALKENDPLAAELKRSKAQAELDAAILRFDLGLTYIGDDEVRQKGEEIVKAQKEFDKIANSYANTRVGYLATVWSLQCSFVNGEAAKAVPAIEKFVAANRNNREAADAVRLAGFFGIEHVFEADTVKDTPAGRLIRTEQAAQRWLQTYPESRNTPEGLGAQYRRALMKELQAFLPGGVIFETPKKKAASKEEKDPPAGPRKIIGISPQAKQLLIDANKIYKSLSDTDNEYSDRAQRRRLMNQLVILEAEGKGGDPPLKSINTLEQGYLAAQVQQARIIEINKDPGGKEPAEVDKIEKDRINKAVAYLERGLQRATPNDPVRDVFDAQMLLVQFLTKQDRAIEAAVLGEGLARNNPKISKASTAAALAVFAYNSGLAKLKESPARTDEAEAADMRRIIDLATFAEKNWPNDGPTDAVRHVLAFYQNRGDDPETAWKTYSRISNGYSELYQARREMAGVMFYMIRPEDRDPKKYRETLEKNITARAQQLRATLAALEAMPDPPASAPAHHVDSWAGARTMQAQLYYMKNDYDKVDSTVKNVVEILPRLASLDAKKREDLAYTIRSLKYMALQGRASEFIKAREFAKVGKNLGAELAALKKEMKAPAPKEAPPPGFDRMRSAQRNFLIVCMSAFVQNKQADQASELLEALQSSGGTVESNFATMRSLNNTIRGELDDLKKEGKNEEAEALAKSFTEFLDNIQGTSDQVIVLRGQGYAAVDQPTKAAELFEQIIKKPFEPDPKMNQAEQDAAKAKHTIFIRQMEFFQARAYRQAGSAGGGKPDFDKAMELMKKIVGDPLKKGTRGWGYANIEIRKEYNMLLEDQKFYGPAISNWVRMTNEFVPGGLPRPIRFLGQRIVFINCAESADCVATGSVGPVKIVVDQMFKAVLPAVAERRNSQRQLYFDLFVEAQRCSARAYNDPDIVAKLKGGQATAEQKLSDIGQKLFDLLTKNDDVSNEVKENVRDLVEKHPVMKKKFDELMATAPKMGG